MTTDRRGILFLAIIALASYAMIVGLQPYSVRSPWERWDEPGRRYFESASRLNPALGPWAILAHASMGFHRNDTLDVWYGTLTDPCSYRLSFVGEQNPRVVGAHASCNFSAGWPIDPTVIKISR